MLSLVLKGTQTSDRLQAAISYSWMSLSGSKILIRVMPRCVLGTSIRSGGRIERRTTRRNRTAANERRSAAFRGRKGTRRPTVREMPARPSRPAVVVRQGDDTKVSGGRPVTRTPAAGWAAMRNLDPDGPTESGVAGLFPSGLRLITGGIPTGRSRGARRLVGREWFCDIRRRRRRARLTPSPILRVGGGGAGGQDGEGLGPQELPPRGSDPPGRRPQAAPAQHGGDRRGGDPDPELEELALDPQVAPPGVFPSQAKDQLAQFGIDRRASRPAARPRVHSALELAAPALERLGHDSEGRPPLPGEEPARRGEEGPVGGAVAGPLPSPGEHPQLMAEHGDLQFPVIQARPNEQADQAA